MKLFVRPCTWNSGVDKELRLPPQIAILLTADSVNMIFNVVYIYTALIIHFGLSSRPT